MKNKIVLKSCHQICYCNSCKHWGMSFYHEIQWRFRV